MRAVTASRSRRPHQHPTLPGSGNDHARTSPRGADGRSSPGFMRTTTSAASRSAGVTARGTRLRGIRDVRACTRRHQFRVGFPVGRRALHRGRWWAWASRSAGVDRVRIGHLPVLRDRRAKSRYTSRSTYRPRYQGGREASSQCERDGPILRPAQGIPRPSPCADADRHIACEHPSHGARRPPRTYGSSEGENCRPPRPQQHAGGGELSCVSHGKPPGFRRGNPRS